MANSEYLKLPAPVSLCRGQAPVQARPGLSPRYLFASQYKHIFILFFTTYYTSLQYTDYDVICEFSCVTQMSQLVPAAGRVAVPMVTVCATCAFDPVDGRAIVVTRRYVVLVLVVLPTVGCVSACW